MSADGRAVANYILDRCEANGSELTNLALQKLIYFCHAWMLVEYKEPLIRHQFEAWEHGPVLPYLYRDFKHHGEKKITSRAMSINLVTGRREVAVFDCPKEKIEFLNSIIDLYARLSAFDLVKMSHVAGGPWDQAWQHAGKTNPGMKISNQTIGGFYESTRFLFPLEYGTVQ